MGKPRSSLFRSLCSSGARRVGRRLLLYAVFTAAVTLGAVALIEEEGGNVTRSEVTLHSIIGIGHFAPRLEPPMVVDSSKVARAFAWHSQIMKGRFND